MDVRQQARPQEPGASGPVTSTRTHSDGSWGGKKLFFVLGSLAALLGVIALASMGYSKVVADTAVNSKEYQAVFLTNGQVYFGHLSHVDSGYVKLKDIYYLQVQQQVQPSSQTSTSNQQPQISLAKLGNELHGPEDSMYVAKSQVLFWENLKKDGKVTQAIQSYQKK